MGSFTPPPTTALTPGDRLDRYELLCVLAQGGMGTVWLARLSGKHGFERLVALKTILPTYSTDRLFCDMFLDEARIAAQIDHENVARILEIGEDRGFIFYAMELIDGESLRKLYRDVRAAGQTFPMAIALRIAADACAGLHATHELHDEAGQPLEVVHRDVSPQNLLVSIRGTTKLIDFGVAKANARRSEETAAGTLKGKIEYMAPEQARGERLDRRADVYSIGAVLYELLASKPVRDTDEGRQLAALHELMTGVAYPPLPESIPHVVRSVVDRAIARDPATRFPSADALRYALEQSILATGATASTDDVAAMLAHYSRERTAKRKDAMERAVRAATEGRLNAATIVAPLSASHSVTQHLSPSSHASRPSGAMSVPQMPMAGYGGHAGPAGQPAPPFPPPPPSSVPLGGYSGVDGITGPSMRTIGPAAVTSRPARGGGAMRAIGAIGVLLLVGIGGVVAGVVITRRGQVASAAAGASSGELQPVKVAPEPESSASAAPTTPMAAAAGEPSVPATGVVADAGIAPAAGTTTTTTTTTSTASTTATSTTTKRDAGAGKGGQAGPKQAGKPGDGDEYGF